MDKLITCSAGAERRKNRHFGLQTAKGYYLRNESAQAVRSYIVKVARFSAGCLTAYNKSDFRFITTLLLIAFLIRTAWILLVSPAPVSDFNYYYNYGISIAMGQGYCRPDGVPTAFWPVGYPAFLGLLFYFCGASLFVGKFANVIMSVLTLAVFYKFSLIITPDRRTARMAAVLASFFPSQIAYCSLMSDTILFQFLLYSGLLLLSLRTSRLFLFLAGTIFGLATLVRPYALVVPLIFIMVYWRALPRLRILRFMAGIYPALLLVVLPWSVRNFILFGGFVPVSNNGGFNLLIGNSPQSSGRYNPIDFEISRYTDEYELDQAAGQKAVRYIREHPFETLKMAIPKLYYMYYDDANALWWNLAGYRYKHTSPPAQVFKKKDLPAVVVFQGYYYLILFGFVGFLLRNYLLRKPVQKIQPVGLAIIIYFSLIAIVFFGDPRFRLPINPLLGVYFSAFIFSLLQGRASATKDHP